VQARHFATVALCVATSFCGAFVGCTGDDPVVATGAEDAGSDQASSVASDASTTTDAGGALDAADGAPACPGMLPFVDDFEGRTGLVGCWDGLTKSGALAATSNGELGKAPGSGGAFHVTLVPPDGGASGGAVYLSKKLATPAPAPVRLSFKWLLDTFPVGGDGSNGLFAVELVYRYTEAGFGKVGSASVAFGVSNKAINPYLKGSPFTPVDTVLEAGGLFESALELGTTEVKLSTNTGGTTPRTATLPTGTNFAVTEIRIGVTDVGSLTGPWSLYFDDIRLETQ
jgi:hypothetical protein